MRGRIGAEVNANSGDQQRKLFKVEIEGQMTLLDFAKWSVGLFPELKVDNLEEKKGKGVISYVSVKNVVIDGRKYLMEKLEFSAATSRTFLITVGYVSPIFRPFLLLFSLLGLALGVVPGIIIYLIFRDWGEAERVKKLLARFEAVMSEGLSREPAVAVAPLAGAPVRPSDNSPQGKGLTESMGELKSLHESGMINDAEYAEKKAELLRRL